eukprot:11220024-Lingulodinium_polyedra.AAC.1
MTRGPAPGLASGDGDEEGDGAPDLPRTSSTEMPPCPSVALCGRLLSRSLLAAWWGRRAGRAASR